MLPVPTSWLIAGAISTAVTFPMAYAVGVLFGIWWGFTYGIAVSFGCTWWAINRVRR